MICKTVKLSYFNKLIFNEHFNGNKKKKFNVSALQQACNIKKTRALKIFMILKSLSSKNNQKEFIKII